MRTFKDMFEQLIGNEGGYLEWRQPARAGSSESSQYCSNRHGGAHMLGIELKN